MKRICIFVLLVIFGCITPCPVKADNTPKVFLNGKELVLEVSPVVVDGRVMLPMTTIFRSLGNNVGYRDPYLFWGDGSNHWIEVGAYTAQVGTKVINLDAPAQIIDGRAMITLKTIAEICMCKVEYDSSTKTVYISSGSTQFKNMVICGGYDPVSNAVYSSMLQTTDSPALTAIDNKSPGVSAQCTFSNITANKVKFCWYYCRNGNKQLVYENSVNVSNSMVSNTDQNMKLESQCVAISVLPQNKYQNGYWSVEASLNGVLLGTKDFQIDNYGRYGSFKWTNGTCEGYLWDWRSQGKEPFGAGQITLKDGTIFRGSLDYCAGYAYFKNGTYTFAPSPPVDDYTKAYIMQGSWKYTDGSYFIGMINPGVVAEKRTDLNAAKYDFCYDIEGYYYDKNGNSRKIYGHYKGFNPSYRFDKFEIQKDKLWDAYHITAFVD